MREGKEKLILPSELRTKVNKISHAAGLEYGEQTKRRLLADLEHRQTAGANIAELRKFLDGVGKYADTGDITPRQTHHAHTAKD
jgi:hypothetical protein